MRDPRSRALTVLALVGFAIVYLALAVSSYRQKSATWDEPLHLAAGYGVLAADDYRLDPEHPPLIRAWAALPLVFDGAVEIDEERIGRPDWETWVEAPQFLFGHQFLYQRNDAGGLLKRARMMIVLLGVALGVVVFLWSRQLYGFGAAVGALGIYALEPNGLAHARLVTTDFGFALFGCATLYFLWRLCRELSLGHLVALAACFALSLVTKFTAVGLIPIVVMLLLVRSVRSAEWPTDGKWTVNLATRRRRLAAAAGVLVTLGVVGWLAIWASYGFRHAPSAETNWHFAVDEQQRVLERMPTTARTVGWLDDRGLLPEPYLHGFLLSRVKAVSRSAYLLGEIRTDGWWYYFPLAFLVKTPVTLLVLLAAAVLAAAVRRRNFLDDEIFLLLPMAVFFAAAMSSSLNIGLRHLLVVFPLAIVAASRSIRLFWTEGRRLGRVVLGLLGLLLIWEHAAAYPDYLPFFNQLAGGSKAGHNYLVDSNLDWGQDLPALAEWMEAEGVETINLSYFGMADPAYYGIEAVHLVGAPLFALDRVALPRLPGWVAISATHAAGVNLDRSSQAFLAPLVVREPDVVLGKSLYLYRADRPWW